MTNPTAGHASEANGRSQSPNRRWRFLAAFLLIAALFATIASAMGPRGWHSRGPFGHGEELPVEEIQEHLAVKLKWALKRIDATPEQSAQIESITFAALERLMALRESRTSLRDQVTELLQAETVDREALEALRLEKVQQMDAASREIVTAMADILEVLTPEQRSLVLERFEHAHH